LQTIHEIKFDAAGNLKTALKLQLLCNENALWRLKICGRLNPANKTQERSTQWRSRKRARRGCPGWGRVFISTLGTNRAALLPFFVNFSWKKIQVMMTYRCISVLIQLTVHCFWHLTIVSTWPKSWSYINKLESLKVWVTECHGFEMCK